MSVPVTKNSSTIVSALNEIYSDAATIAQAKDELESGNIALYGRRVLTMATNAGKGWFAILIGKLVDHHTIIPNYIIQAIFFAHGSISRSLVGNILDYRLKHIAASEVADAEAVANFRNRLEEFREDRLDFRGIRAEMMAAFPADQINNILAVL